MKSWVKPARQRVVAPLLLAAALPAAAAQPAAEPPPSPVIEALGSVDVGVAWQVTEFDIGSGADGVTTTMSNGFEATPLLRAQIPVRMLWSTAGHGLGYTVRASYRRFALERQDLGGTADEEADYGTRVRGHALYVLPYLVGRVREGNSELTAGLGVGLGQLRASGDVLVRGDAGNPTALAREAVDIDGWSTAIGAFLEYRYGRLVAGMETVILAGRGGGRDYDLGLSAFTLGWRIDF